MKRYYADMSDMRDAGGIADDEFVLSDDYAALEAERDALQNGLKRIIEEGSYDGAYPGERILVNLAQSALAATEVK
jgi:hypothetical protein